MLWNSLSSNPKEYIMYILYMLSMYLIQNEIRNDGERRRTVLVLEEASMSVAEGEEGRQVRLLRDGAH